MPAMRAIPASEASPGGPASRLRLVRPVPSPICAPVLDEAQRAAVEHRGGPLLVLAGPGTGKTTTLVEAVVDRVERDGAAPEEVLMLTFSRRAAAELRDRVTARLGRTVREPLARTFHSYAFGLLRQEALLRGESAPALLSGPEQDLLIRELLRGDVEEFAGAPWPQPLHPALATRGFARELRDLLLRCWERGVEPAELARRGHERGRDDWVAAARFARQYAGVTALRPPPAYDPAQLVRAAVSLLRDDSRVLARERAARVAVLVDEYQDCDPAQEELLQLLAGDGRDLLVVGDPDQAIYGFRGADVECIHRFPERFRAGDDSPAPVVALTSCRRSGAQLLGATRRVAARLGGPPGHRMLTPAAEVPPGSVEVLLLRSAAQEAEVVAQRLRASHLVDKVPWSQQAVLVRGARALPVLRRGLTAAGIPVTVRLEEVALVDEPAVQPLLRILEVATGRRTLDAAVAEELVTGPYGGADPLALRRLRRELRSHELATGGGRSSAELLVEALQRRVELVALDSRAVAPARRVAELLGAARGAANRPRATSEDVLWSVWSTSGVAHRWSERAIAGGPGAAIADRDLDGVVALFDVAARLSDRMPAAGPAALLEHLLGQQIPADSLAARAPRGEAVTLLTAHAAKGLQWQVVVVAGVQEGSWPDLRPRGSLLGAQALVDELAGRDVSPAAALSAVLAEERRLFYVAATRASRRLLVTAVSGEDAQPSRFLDELSPWEGPEPRPLSRVPRGLDLPSVVAELRAVTCAVDGAEVAGAPVDAERRAGAAAQLVRLAAEGVPAAAPENWYGLLRLSDERPIRLAEEPVRVSPSKVEAFARCELRWFLEACGGTREDSTDQSIGTMVHALAHDVATGRTTPAELPQRFAEQWLTVDAGTGWYARREHDRAAAMVERLAAWLRDNPRELVAAEQHFSVDIDVDLGVDPELNPPGNGPVDPSRRATLSGRVDRVERDAAGRLVVVDLKTGSSRPKSEEVLDHAQLGAYQQAVALGAFGPATPGGAALVQLGGGARGGGATEQHQPPLSDAPDPGWAQRLVGVTALRMAGAAFTATENRWCARCPVRASCPAHDDGRQVTG